MTDYPEHIQQMLAKAREKGQWYNGQIEASAICYAILAQFPDHHEASELIYELFCEEWFVYNQREAIQHHIEEWDDRPWQHRHRIATSYSRMRFLREYDREEHASKSDEWNDDDEDAEPFDVEELLDEGQYLLLRVHCYGDEPCADRAWVMMSLMKRMRMEKEDAQRVK